MLRAPAVAVLLIIAVIVVGVFITAWPTYRENGLAWLGSGGEVDRQLDAMINAGANPGPEVYYLRAWPLIWATILTTGLAVLIATVTAVFTAVFIVEFAPPKVEAVLVPMIRLLAAVPSVIYGLIGILVVAPWVNDNLITAEQRKSVEFIIPLTGPGLLVATVILTLMITPIMVSLVTEALRSIPRGWKEGALALGVNRWRAMWSVSVKAARPAIVAAGVIATARALGEAIMLAMVSGSKGFAPQPWDGIIFFFEPLRPLAATIADNAESLNSAALRSSLYAFASLLLLSTFALSLGAYIARQPLRKYGIR
ncbi:MAG: phosphate ABC transporter permease subunit PstC [Solirubrobacteraceae bacterium]|nr:phosphate ABC transporter permease subunit PstC [Solirubrobacteraceae bacterium]